MLILKLGGAAITDKDIPDTARPDVLRRIAGLIAAYQQPMILVHGAGSFGHITAKAYDLHRGLLPEQRDRQREGLVRLQVQLHELNRLVIDSLIEAGLPAVSVHPASMCVMENRRIVSLFTEPIHRLLDMALLPVLYGDCVWDRGQRFGIVSGDQLMIHLANEFTADCVAFGTNVDGVLDADGKVIPFLNLSQMTHISDHSGQNHPRRADVTGGMQGKLQEIAAIRNPSSRIWIFNLANIDALERILAGGDNAGTLISTG